MFTPASSSLTATSPLPSQSPVHASTGPARTTLAHRAVTSATERWRVAPVLAMRGADLTIRILPLQRATLPEKAAASGRPRPPPEDVPNAASNSVQLYGWVGIESSSKAAY